MKTEKFSFFLYDILDFSSWSFSHDCKKRIKSQTSQELEEKNAKILNIWADFQVSCSLPREEMLMQIFMLNKEALQSIYIAEKSIRKGQTELYWSNNSVLSQSPIRTPWPLYDIWLAIQGKIPNKSQNPKNKKSRKIKNNIEKKLKWDSKNPTCKKCTVSSLWW